MTCREKIYHRNGFPQTGPDTPNSGSRIGVGHPARGLEMRPTVILRTHETGVAAWEHPGSCREGVGALLDGAYFFRG